MTMLSLIEELIWSASQKWYNKNISWHSKNCNGSRTGHGSRVTAGCLLDYNYFKKHYYKLIAIDLSKQQALDFDPKAIQQINFTGNLDR